MDKQYRTAQGLFEWDEAKAASNLKKHGISFESAAKTFGDEYGLLVEDTIHSDDEDRYHWIAMLDNALVLLTVFTEKDCIRIISARKATKKEEVFYAINR